jgi:hypothetical protein
MRPDIIMTIDFWVAVRDISFFVPRDNEFLIIGDADRLNCGAVHIVSFSVKFFSIPLYYVSVRGASENIFPSLYPLDSK